MRCRHIVIISSPSFSSFSSFSLFLVLFSLSLWKFLSHSLQGNHSGHFLPPLFLPFFITLSSLRIPWWSLYANERLERKKERRRRERRRERKKKEPVFIPLVSSPRFFFSLSLSILSLSPSWYFLSLLLLSLSIYWYFFRLTPRKRIRERERESCVHPLINGYIISIFFLSDHNSPVFWFPVSLSFSLALKMWEKEREKVVREKERECFFTHYCIWEGSLIDNVSWITINASSFLLLSLSLLLFLSIFICFSVRNLRRKIERKKEREERKSVGLNRNL